MKMKKQSGCRIWSTAVLADFEDRELGILAFLRVE